MARSPGGGGRGAPYWLSFAFITLVLGGLTTVFVLVVLPQRFVLRSGLRESGISFPARAPSFRSVEGVVVVPRRPAPAPPEAPEPEPGPGPAEALWERVGPLLRAGDHERALPLFSEYLSSHPGDMAVRLEHGVALARSGRPREAEAELERVVRATGEPRARLALARLLRDRGETARALSLYRGLVTERPEDPALRHELARTLAWAARWDEAAAEYRALLAAAPDPGYRLELARTLYWAGRPGEAGEALAAIPEDAPEREEAAELAARLEELLAAEGEPPVPPAAEDPLARARRAAAEGDHALASRLYRRLLEERPRDPDLWLEWADFLQFRADDLEGARAALLARARLVEPGAEEALRLARLHVWTGREAAARASLEEILRESPDLADAWALLGDVRRWEGARPAAVRAYRRALVLSPEAEVPREGLAEVRAETRRIIAVRELPGLGPEVSFFRDSDGYRRLDLAGRATVVRSDVVVGVQSGYRRLEGLGPAGVERAEEGPFAEVEVARWWREGTLRTSVTAGAERLDAFGVEPSFGARLEVPDLDGLALEAEYRHGPAYPVAITLESVVETVRADHLRASAYRGLAGGWAVSGVGEVASVRGAGSDNWRLGGGVSLLRRLSPVLGVGVGSQLLGYTDAAPVPEARRLYWDPRVFWSGAVTLEARLPGEGGWTAHGRLRPGIALVDERAPLARETVPQLAMEAGFGYRGDRATFAVDAFHLRGREGDYNSLGVGLRLVVRP